MKSFNLAVFTTAIFLLMSCGKKEGCTDQLASNYDSKAKENCCCEYEGQVVFWYNKDVCDYWALKGVTSVKFYLDEVLIYTKSPTEFWTGPPTCGESGSLTFTKKGNEEHIIGFIKIFDQNGAQLYYGDQTFHAGECSRYQHLE